MIEKYGMSCATCPAFAPAVDASGNVHPTTGRCQMNPPTLLVMPGRIMTVGGMQDRPELQSDYPPTLRENHCWQYPQMVAIQRMLDGALQKQAEAKAAAEASKPLINKLVDRAMND